MSQAKDLTGKKFGRLTAIESLGSIKSRRYWHVRCDCGNEDLVQAGHLSSGHTQSCGCLKVDNKTVHGQSESPDYKIWATLKCISGRDMFPKWNDFQGFVEDVGLRPSIEHQLARRDIREPHGPFNTYWRDPIEQQRQRNLTHADLGKECFIDM